jgi:hypothetical protein
MDTFLANNRDELIARCKAKVAQRPSRRVTQEQLENGIPLFLEQLRRTLVAEKAGEAGKSGATGGLLKRSLAALKKLVDSTLEEVRI